MAFKMNSPFKKQKLSAKAAKAKAIRDLAAAKTPYRKDAKADSQKKHRDNPGSDGLDYDHKTQSFVSVETNRGNSGKGTKSEGDNSYTT
jgi:hypothetical protein